MTNDESILFRYHCALSFLLCALILYPFAVLLPILSINRFGHQHEASIFDGIVSLWQHSSYFLSLLIAFFSLFLPLCKIICLLLLQFLFVNKSKQRMQLYHLIEWTSKWSMLDVMLVAVLVASVKIGDMVSISPSLGLLCFALMLCCSLVGSSLHPKPTELPHD